MLNMASIDFNSMLSQMIDAAKTSLADKWPTVENLATSSLKSIAQNVIDIEIMTADNTITREQSVLKIMLQQNAFRTMLLTQEGIGLLAAQDALNAVTDVIRSTVNKAIGLVLL